MTQNTLTWRLTIVHCTMCQVKFREKSRGDWSFLNSPKKEGKGNRISHIKREGLSHSVSSRLRLDIAHLKLWLIFFRWKVYEVGLSWKFQHKLITCSKDMTPQSWHGQQNKGGQVAWVHFWVSITYFVLNPNLLNLLHCSVPGSV